LIGEALVKNEEPTQKLKELLSWKFLTFRIFYIYGKQKNKIFKNKNLWNYKF
jgi:hypothetical protein